MRGLGKPINDLMNSVVFWLIMRTNNLVVVVFVFSLRIILLLDLNVSCMFKLGRFRNIGIACSTSYTFKCQEII